MSDSIPPCDTITKPIPEGFVVHTEGTTSILFASPAPSTSTSTPSSSKQSKQKQQTDKPAQAPVFLNPIQQYNRDLSVCAIRTWSDLRAKEKTAVWEQGVRKKREKQDRKKKVGASGTSGAGQGGKRKADEVVNAVDGEGEAVEEAAQEGSAQAVAETAADAQEEQLEGAGRGKRRKAEDGSAVSVPAAAPVYGTVPVDDGNQAPKEHTLTPPIFGFTALEALSATGLRAIRYAKEIPLLRSIIANDLSSSAVADIKRNVEFNGLAPPGLPPTSSTSSSEPPVPGPTMSKAKLEELTLGKVRPNEGDACAVMYNHRSETTRFDCIDLDPYGSAVPFLDAAVGSVADGGLLCVTCTDAGVLAGHNYPEKAFTHYGGVCVNAEYSHEVGLRLILHAIATAAGRYGRSIEPLLSLSIDFYMRVFVRVRTSPKEVKSLPSKISLLYYCHDCQAPFFQPMGRVNSKPNPKDAKAPPNLSYSVPAGPPEGVQDRCGECGGKFHIGGPMWGDPIHHPEFVQSMLNHTLANRDDFGTHARIEGMLSVAQDELESPLYFTPARMAGLFHSVAPPIATVASALLNGGYRVSRSHASAGSIKTDAPRAFVMDIMREWVKLNPVKMDNVKENSPSARLLAKPQSNEIDLTPNKQTDSRLMSKAKLVRYQVNPEPNWGPGRLASRGAAKEKPHQQ